MKRVEISLRVVGGHHQVGMLWKSDTPWLPNNKHTAEARLLSLKRKLKRDENFHSKCREFMENLIQKGYTRKLTEEEAVRRSQMTWYFPHHGVLDPQKQDKIRVVFDAASLHDGLCPNNRLLQGPDLPDSLLGISLRFIQYPAALVADIEGMFNQVKVEQTFVHALRILRSQPFLFKVRKPHQLPTKRGILSAVRSLYYPMGFVCQFVLEAKKVLQRMRKLHLEWDDLIPIR